jgi:hypothetical protein
VSLGARASRTSARLAKPEVMDRTRSVPICRKAPCDERPAPLSLAGVEPKWQGSAQCMLHAPTVRHAHATCGSRCSDVSLSPNVLGYGQRRGRPPSMIASGADAGFGEGPPSGPQSPPLAGAGSNAGVDPGLARARSVELLEAARWRWLSRSLEVIGAFGGAGLLTWSARSIQVDPLERVGQVSALASIGLRFTVTGLLIVALLHVASRVRGGVAFPIASRVAFAILAGLATGFVAAGIVVALRGTPWCLNGQQGDAGRLARWAVAVLHRRSYPPYPPLPVHTIALYAHLADLPAAYALKHLQIIGTALVGPVAYLSWRVLASPPWALGLGVVAALPLIDPYKPYANTVLIMLVPALVFYLGWLRRAGEVGYQRLALAGVAFGVAFGVLYLTYYGWFQWSAPGAVVAALVLFPWQRRSAWLRGGCLLLATLLPFAAIAGPFVVRGLRDGFADNFFYFDTNTDPAYFAMWRWDLPGPTVEWPPPGELGGVGLFTLLMAAGIGTAIALGRRRVLVTTVGCLIGGAWVMRFWYAHHMWKTKLVQLYPRTSIEITYCSLLLCGYALYLLVARRERERERREALLASGTARRSTPSLLIGAIAGSLLVLGSAGSALADRYMPANVEPPSLGLLALQAQHAPH